MLVIKSKPAAASASENFTAALRKVLRVSHTELKARIEADRKARKARRGKLK